MAFKMFRVTCCGMQDSHGISYVVAEDAHDAYMRVRADLDKRDLGFRHERALQSVELMADATEYPDCGRTLYLPATPAQEP